jgi:flagellar biosynthesis protein FlhB
LRALGLLWLAPAVAALCAVVAQRAPTLRWFSEVTDRGGERRGRPARSRLTATLFTALKLLVLAVGLGAKLYDSWPGLLSAYELDAAELLAACARVGVALFWRAALLLLALGVLELGAQQLARLRRLRMTRAQVQQEQRELFGDPHMLAERRARSSGGAGGAMTMERLAPQLRAAALAQLSAASLLLTGAGRVVALRYVPAQDSVPIVWLKAEGTHAVELLQRAYHLDIPLATDNPMVAELFQHELLTPIPMACYSRVAQLLAASVGDAQATGVAS